MKSNKECAVEVAIAMINANPRVVQNNNVTKDGINAGTVCSIIKSVEDTLEQIDKKYSK